MNSWNGPLSIHDDHAAIIQNEFLYRSPFRRCWGASRPLVEMVNWLNYRYCRFRPRPWHMLNVLLHVCATGMLWLLLARLGFAYSSWLSLAFFLHPVQVHSWAYVTGRSGILAAIFLFLASRVYLSAHPVLSVIPALAAMLSREDSMVFVLWLPILEWFR